MSQKGTSSLNNTLNAAITDQQRKENTSQRVRGWGQDIHDSFLNLTDGGVISGPLTTGTFSASTLTANTINIFTSAANFGLDYYNSNILKWRINVDGSDYFRIHPDGFGGAYDFLFAPGKLGIGKTPSSYALDVNGQTNTNVLSATTLSATTANASILNLSISAVTNPSDGNIWNENQKINIQSGIAVKYLSGATDRIVEAGTGGTFSASKDLISAWVSSASAITALETTSNWNVLKSYTGATLTDCLQGQMHYDANYAFLMVADSVPIRLTRA